MKDLPVFVRLSVLLRSLLIQVGWNRNTWIGEGFAFTYLPILRRLHGSDRVRFEAALERHRESFNAHPVLATLAVGALARMEEEGSAEEMVLGMRTALRSALGGIGDALIWNAMRPTILLSAIVAVVLGAPPLLAAGLAVGTFGAMTLTLRSWGISYGYLKGDELARGLAHLRLPSWVPRVRRIGLLALGVSLGVLSSHAAGEGGAGLVYILVGAVAFVLGTAVGIRAWALSIGVFVAVLSLVLLGGLL